MKLTAASPRKLALPDGVREKIYFDEDVAGFGLRLRAGGSLTWVIQYKVAGKSRRLNLGRVGAIDFGKARDAAKDLLAAVRLGRDPLQDKIEARDKAAVTFGGVLPRYLKHKKASVAPRSLEEIERHLQKHAEPLHAKALTAIDRRMIATRLSEITEKTPPTANRVRASLSGFFTWAIKEGLIDNNPVSYTNKNPENDDRERVLSPTELKEIWDALGEGHYADIVRLLLLTGARRKEIAGLRFSELEPPLQLMTILGSRTKNHLPHEIPLTPAILAVLGAQPRRLENGEPRDLMFGFAPDHGFQTWSANKKDLVARINAARAACDNAEPMPRWRLHDFRQTMSTVMHEDLKILPHIVEEILGHVDGHKRGVKRAYNKARYRVDKARALALWNEYVMSAVGGNVVTLEKIS
jgi:integrase